MGNIATWLKRAEEQNGEQITHIVIGRHDRDRDWGDKPEDRRPEHAQDKVISRKEGLKILDVDYDSGYGGADCFPMYAWSDNWVFSVSEYDGSTGLSQFPRHPIDCKPEFD